MSNINGKVYAMNAITPMKTWKTWILRVAFFVLDHVKPMQKDLIDLSFIEFARWVVVPRNGLPFLGNGQQEEELTASRDRVTPIVLLILARSHARIIGGDDDQRAADAGVGSREERVGGYVEADVFHRAQRPRPAESRADGDFQRHLLVRRPLGMPA